MNLGRRLGELQLAAGFYGPAEGPPAMVRNKAGGLECTTLSTARRVRTGADIVGASGFAARILAALPILEEHAAAAGALSLHQVAAAIDEPGKFKTIAAYLSQMRGIQRFGRTRKYRYYRLPQKQGAA